jgi:hypothetical protein
MLLRGAVIRHFVVEAMSTWSGRIDDPLEYAAKNIAIAETLVAGAGERRMMRHSILDTELEEPAIGEDGPTMSVRGGEKRISRLGSPTSAFDPGCVKTPKGQDP